MTLLFLEQKYIFTCSWNFQFDPISWHNNQKKKLGFISFVILLINFLGVVQGNKTVWVIDIFLSASCQSQCDLVCFREFKVFSFVLIPLWLQKKKPLGTCYASALDIRRPLDIDRLNGIILEQPSPYQQDETCCVACFLSANLQLPSKPLPLIQAGLLLEADRFYIISLHCHFLHFLSRWENATLMDSSELHVTFSAA